MSFAVGALVRARGREWVVLPESSEELLMLRPLGGTEDETTGILPALENIESAQFSLPDISKPGDYRSARLLRDAIRLGFRSSAGPFRSFGRIAVEPRPYQLVPLLMALNLDPIRMLIADDVGIGKTVEACLIARELLDRGEIKRIAVLCPPHLAGQWQTELSEKFHIDAELVLPSTITRLSRNCLLGQSIFDIYPNVIVSSDFIKSERYRHEFVRACPEFVIVDEAHTCASAGQGRGSQHQRHQLIKDISANPSRHLVLVTATPHSGNEDAFRSLLALLKREFVSLPENLTGTQNEQYRRQLADHLVQRRRGDIRYYLDTDTPFPKRDDKEEHYKLSEDYKKLFNRVLNYARETVTEASLEGITHRQRVRWWSALALLRSLASSPAAAALTLRTRATTADTETIEEADEIGKRTILDITDDESVEGSDITPGSLAHEDEDENGRNRRRLLDMAREAESLMGAKDTKLQQAIKLVKSLVADGYKPIVFCRFIATAEYVADAFRGSLGRNVDVAAITGTLPPVEREERIRQLGQSEKHVLVATDCLSEGINLQEHFDAVIHYDLSWNPTRHEQREGRVDRFGQSNPEVRVITYYGIDNQIDGIVLDVLIRKHKTIRTALGISVPVPVDTDQVIQAIFEGVLLRGGSTTTLPQTHQDFLPGFEEHFKPEQDRLNKLWDAVSEREKQSRTMFAQRTIKVDEVAQELNSVRHAIGSGVDVARFMTEALKRSGATVNQNGTTRIDLTETTRDMREAIGLINANEKIITAKFELPIQEKEILLNRTHPIIEGLASYIMETALDSGDTNSIASRCSVIRTNSVERRTTALLVRFRYHIITKRDGVEYPLLAEDCKLLAFRGSPQNAEWVSEEIAETLLQASPDANIAHENAVGFLNQIINNFEHIEPHLTEVAVQNGESLLDAHRRVRSAARVTGITYRIEPKLPPDVLGIFMYLPV